MPVTPTRLLVAGCSLAVLAACAAAPPRPIAARVPTVTADVDQAGCTQNAFATSELAQNLGPARARCRSGMWNFVVPAQNPAPTPRRTEIVWGLRHGTLDVGDGARLVFDADIIAHLGPAADSDRDWHVLWQLVGRTRGEWKAPDIQIGVRAGQLRVWGGASHAEHRWGGPDYSWVRPLGPYEDGRRYRVRLETRLSTDPARSRISAWLDGRAVVTNWSPVSEQGLPPGTIVPEQSEVHVRSCLYRGTDAPAQPPGYAQWVTLQVHELS